MSDWTEVGDIRQKLMREWDRGVLLACCLRKEAFTPRRLSLKKPGSKEWLERYEAAKAWAGALVAAEKKNHFALELLEVNHRQLGRNSFPQAVVFQTEESLFRFIGKIESVEKFDDLCKRILSDFPELRFWLEKLPLLALDNYGNWPSFLAVLSFLKANPRPGIYVRQLEIPGIDTKFVEKHRKLLGELLDQLLPEEAIDWSVTGAKKFELRYGFIPKPVQIRFRILDEDQYLAGLSDLQIPVNQFRGLQLDIDTVFITENEINGLAFPDVKRAIIIFGLGFGLDRLSEIPWLLSKDIYYWGDIDTHGFVMLDQLRSYFVGATSFLMDKETLLFHRTQWGVEDRPSKRDLKRLVGDEGEVYRSLVRDELAVGLRLEQEKICYNSVKQHVSKLRCGFVAG